MTPQPCPECGMAVIPTHHLLLDAQGTTTGPYSRVGLHRHANDIARSVHHDRRDGFSPHYCTGARP